MTPVVNKSGLTNAEFAALTAPTLKADNGVKLELEVKKLGFEE